MCHYVYFNNFTYDRVVLPCDESIWEAWRTGKESLRYLFKPYYQIILRRIHVVTRKSDPRWKSGRWKAKT